MSISLTGLPASHEHNFLTRQTHRSEYFSVYNTGSGNSAAGGQKVRSSPILSQINQILMD
jgi:hypothetical protein